MAEIEEKGKRPVSSNANINRALDKAHEKKSFVQICKEPVSAIQGLAEWVSTSEIAIYVPRDVMRIEF